MNSINDKQLSELIDLIQLKTIKNIYDPIRTMVAIKGMKFLELDANERRILSTLCYIKEGTIKILMTYLAGVPYITISSIIKKLEEMGYVLKYKKDNSKKNIYIKPTDLGMKITEEYDKEAIECSKYLYARYFNNNELNEFYELCKTYLVYLEKLENKD